MVLCDTDVIIEYLKGNYHVKSGIEEIGIDNIILSAITIMELYYGALNKRELQKIKRALNLFKVIELNETITEIAIGLIEKYSKSHGLRIPDALVAASTIYIEAPLWTINKKDFQFIKEVQLI